jgi:hypothetical protein
MQNEEYDNLPKLIEIRTNFSRFVKPLTTTLMRDHFLPYFENIQARNIGKGGFFGGNSWHQNFSLKTYYSIAVELIDVGLVASLQLDTLMDASVKNRDSKLRREYVLTGENGIEAERAALIAHLQAKKEEIFSGISEIAPNKYEAVFIEICRRIFTRVRTQFNGITGEIRATVISLGILQYIFFKMIQLIDDPAISGLYQTIMTEACRHGGQDAILQEVVTLFAPKIKEYAESLPLTGEQLVKTICILKGNIDSLIMYRRGASAEFADFAESHIKPPIAQFVASLPKGYKIVYTYDEDVKFRCLTLSKGFFVELKSTIDEESPLYDPLKLFIPGQTDRLLMYVEVTEFENATFIDSFFSEKTNCLTPYGNAIVSAYLNVNRTKEKGGLNIDDVRDKLLGWLWEAEKVPPSVLLDFFVDRFPEMFLITLPHNEPYMNKRNMIILSLIEKDGIHESGRTYKDVMAEHQDEIVCKRDVSVSFRSLVQSLQTVLENADTVARFEASGGDMLSRYLCPYEKLLSADIDCKVKFVKRSRRHYLRKLTIILFLIIHFFNTKRLFAVVIPIGHVQIPGSEKTMRITIDSTRQESFLSLRSILNFLGLQIDLLSIDLKLNMVIEFSDQAPIHTKMTMSPFDMVLRAEDPGKIAALKSNRCASLPIPSTEALLPLVMSQNETAVAILTPIPPITECIEEVEKLITEPYRTQRMLLGKHEKDLARLAKLKHVQTETRGVIDYSNPCVQRLEQFVAITAEQKAEYNSLLQAFLAIMQLPDMKPDRYVGDTTTRTVVDTWAPYTSIFPIPTLAAIAYMLKHQEYSSDKTVVSFNSSKLAIYHAEMDRDTTAKKTQAEEYIKPKLTRRTGAGRKKTRHRNKRKTRK